MIGIFVKCDLKRYSMNFKKNTGDLYKTILKLEDKNNKLVEPLFKNRSVSECQRKRLKLSGSRPGIVIGRSKICKYDVPMRPILSTVDSSTRICLVS